MQRLRGRHRKNDNKKKVRSNHHHHQIVNVLKRLVKIKSPVKRQVEISRGNDKFIRHISPHLRRVVPCIKELVSKKSIGDLQRFTSRRTPMVQRRRLIHRKQHGGFLQFLAALLPLAVNAIASIFNT